jgi:hypothetical protein
MARRGGGVAQPVPQGDRRLDGGQVETPRQERCAPVFPGVTHCAGEQVPGSPMMDDDGEPRRRSRVLDRDLAAGDPDDL